MNVLYVLTARLSLASVLADMTLFVHHISILK